MDYTRSIISETKVNTYKTIDYRVTETKFTSPRPSRMEQGGKKKSDKIILL